MPYIVTAQLTDGSRGYLNRGGGFSRDRALARVYKQRHAADVNAEKWGGRVEEIADAAKSETIGFEELFAQHPLPWTFDDTHPGFEGRLIVWDANKSIGSVVIDLGDMEDCTMADILLAHAIAALPELIACCEDVATNARVTAMLERYAPGILTNTRATLVKAGVNHA